MGVCVCVCNGFEFFFVRFGQLCRSKLVATFGLREKIRDVLQPEHRDVRVGMSGREPRSPPDKVDAP